MAEHGISTGNEARTTMLYKCRNDLRTEQDLVRVIELRALTDRCSDSESFLHFHSPSRTIKRMLRECYVGLLVGDLLGIGFGATFADFAGFEHGLSKCSSVFAPEDKVIAAVLVLDAFDWLNRDLVILADGLTLVVERNNAQNLTSGLTGKDARLAVENVLALLVGIHGTVSIFAGLVEAA